MKKALLIIVPIIAIAVAGIALYYNSSDEEKKSKYYFDFDEVVHYKTYIDEGDLFGIRQKPVKTTKDSMMLTMAWNYYKIPLNRAVTYLDSIDFKKQEISSSKYPEIKEIFKEDNQVYESPYTCEPVYRNIYVFKKNGKISGLARICNHCGKSLFTGTNADTRNFGSEDEYKKLEELVK